MPKARQRRGRLAASSETLYAQPRAATTDAQPARRSTAFLAYAVVGLSITRFVMRYFTQTSTFVTTPHDMPLVQINKSYLDGSLFEGLQQTLLQHDNVTAFMASPYLSDGAAIKFNTKGEVQFKQDGQWGVLWPYFDMMREAGMNVFVLDVSVIKRQAGQYNASAKPTVPLHVDRALATTSRHKYVADRSSTLWVSVPHDMHGGELHVIPFNEAAPPTKDSPANVTIVPEQNMLVKMRGDAYHRITQLHSSLSTPCISITLQQYQLPSQHFDQTIPYVVVRSRTNAVVAASHLGEHSAADADNTQVHEAATSAGDDL